MKSLILLFTIFLCTLSLNTIVLGQEQNAYSSCPFVLFHIIKEERGWYGSGSVADLKFWLQYGVDLNPNLKDECFDPYYINLPKGTTLLHVLMHSSIDHKDKKSLYWDFLEYGADQSAVNEKGQTASDLYCCWGNVWQTDFSQHLAFGQR